MNKRGGVVEDAFLGIVVILFFMVVLAITYTIWGNYNATLQPLCLEISDATTCSEIDSWGRWFIWLDKTLPFIFLFFWAGTIMSSLLVNADHPFFFIVSVVILCFLTVASVVMVDVGSVFFEDPNIITYSQDLGNSWFFIHNLHYISFFVMIISAVWFYTKGNLGVGRGGAVMRFLLFFLFLILFSSFVFAADELDYLTASTGSVSNCPLVAGYNVAKLYDGSFVNFDASDFVYSNTCNVGGFWRDTLNDSYVIQNISIRELYDATGSDFGFNYNISIDDTVIFEGYHTGDGGARDNYDLVAPANFTAQAGTNITITLTGFDSASHFIMVGEMIIRGDAILAPSNFSVNLNNFWNGSALDDFNVSMVSGGDIYNFSGGVSTTSLITSILNDDSRLFNITINKHNYYGNVSLNYNVSSDLTGTAYQGVVTVFVNRSFLNDEVSNFSLNDSVEGFVGSTAGNNITLFTNADDYSMIVIDNSGVENFSMDNGSFSVSALDNKSVTLTVTGHNIIVRAFDVLNGSQINVFSVDVSGLNFSDERNFSTTSGVVVVPAVDGSYNISVDAVGYSFFNNSEVVTVVNTQQNFSVNISLFRDNSVNFSFFDSDDFGVLLSGVNISLELFGPSSTINLSSSTGSVLVEDLEVGDWQINYGASGFDDNSFFFTVNNRSTNFINLYLNNETVTNLYKIQLRDNNDDIVVGENIRLQRQFVEDNGQYVTIRECITDSEGDCFMEIEESTTINYRFIVVVAGEVVKTTEGAPIIKLASNLKIVTIRVDLGANLIEPSQRVTGVLGTIDFANNISTYEFIDSFNAVTAGCLEVKVSYGISGVSNRVSFSCVSGQNGVLNYDFSGDIRNNSRSSFIFLGSVNYTDFSNPVIVSASKDFKGDGVGSSNSSDNDELFLTLIGFLFISFGMVLVPNFFVQILINFGLMLGIFILGLNALGVPFIMTMLGLGLFITWSRKNARGRIA